MHTCSSSTPKEEADDCHKFLELHSEILSQNTTAKEERTATKRTEPRLKRMGEREIEKFSCRAPGSQTAPPAGVLIIAHYTQPFVTETICLRNIAQKSKGSF